jgi:CheY-like chemotaxis protein
LPVELPGEAEISAQPDEAETGEVCSLAPGTPSYRILIGEDQRENQLLLTQLMSELGLEVKLAEDGEQCVRLFEAWRPDLIWMDRRMPVMDGEEAARRIRRLPGGDKVKIVAVTASAFREEQEEMLAAGMDDFVRKPYRFEEIYDCLSMQLGLRYVYQGAVAPEDAPVELTPALLAGLPEALRAELRHAVESLEIEAIAAAIRRVEAYDPKLADALLRIARGFDYTAILDALDGAGP